MIKVKIKVDLAKLEASQLCLRFQIKNHR